MKKILKGLGMLGLAAVLPMTMVTPAHAISLADCARSDVMHVYGSGVTCFADAGRTDTLMTAVYMVNGGNNQGSIRTALSEGNQVFEFSKWHDLWLGGRYTIVAVRIDKVRN